ncbi:hypothetical protein QT972_00315 [Microcoleus sp. herbarium7]|uniref:hypothetical protein n=1 Tax=Microcoleus sp. herbarium7 TaxID=3055435 RepID=UPI002FD36984
MLQLYPVQMERFQSVLVLQVPALSQADAIARLTGESKARGYTNFWNVSNSPVPGTGRREDDHNNP